MNKREKHIASCMKPTFGAFATLEEIKKVKRLARGHYWYDSDWEEYVSFSPNGRRKFFTTYWYSFASWQLKRKWKSLAKLAAKNWARGNYKKARELEKEFHNLK